MHNSTMLPNDYAMASGRCGTRLMRAVTHQLAADSMTRAATRATTCSCVVWTHAIYLVRTELSRVCELLRSEEGISLLCDDVQVALGARRNMGEAATREGGGTAEGRGGMGARRRVPGQLVLDGRGEYCDACWSKWQML